MADEQFGKSAFRLRIVDLTSTSGKVLTTEVVEIQLFGGFLVHAQQVADGVAADQVTNLFGSVLHMVPGPFDDLCHGDDVNAIASTE
jgi:hypothetical protein